MPNEAGETNIYTNTLEKLIQAVKPYKDKKDEQDTLQDTIEEK